MTSTTYRQFMGRQPGPPPRRSPAPVFSGLRPVTGEDRLHALAIALHWYFESNPLVRVGYRTPIRFDPTNSDRQVTPVMFVARRTVTHPPIDNQTGYRVDRQSPAPDFALEYVERRLTARECTERSRFYLEEVGVGELFVFTPTVREHIRFDAFRFKDGEIKRIAPWMKRWHSSRLRLDFGSPEEGMIAVFDPRAGIQLPTPFEWLHDIF